MAHLIQVGVGSGGMPVLDLLAQDPEITNVTLIEHDIYKSHNVCRHVFPASAVGDPKGRLAARWLEERRPGLAVGVIEADLLDPANAGVMNDAVAQANIGICAADNEPAKYHWDALMRKHKKPWTLGEVLSGGIGGFVHWFVPGGPCYGCVASYLQRSITLVQETTPDYSQPAALINQATVPASKASIHVVASLHALVTLGLLAKGVSYAPGFTTLLMPFAQVPGVFAEAFRPFRFRIDKSPQCLICQAQAGSGDGMSSVNLDDALQQALTRLGNA
jgi:molybdopterin/thiamine biosynthesis adenylyltransferase